MTVLVSEEYKNHVVEISRNSKTDDYYAGFYYIPLGKISMKYTIECVDIEEAFKMAEFLIDEETAKAELITNVS